MQETSSRQGGPDLVVKITSKRQVTLPARELEALGVGPGDRIELSEGPGGFILKPRRVDRPLLGMLHARFPPVHPPFDIATFRKAPYDPALRD